MSQADLGPLDPQTTSGTQLASLLTAWRDALHSLHKGSTRPSYAVTGIMWIDDAGSPWLLKVYDGTEDVLLGEIDPGTHQFTPAGGAVDVGLITGQLVLSGDITPAQITANVNDYSPSGLSGASVLRLSADVDDHQVTGIAGGADGRVLILSNVGSARIHLAAENAGSQAANRFEFDLFLRPGHSVRLWYDATVSRWRATALYVDLAQAGQYRSAAAGRALLADVVWDDAAPVAVSYAANVALDLATGFDFEVGALTGNLTLDNPTNVKPGQKGIIRLVQDATGGRTLALGANWKTSGGAGILLSTAANAVDYLSYYARSSSEILLSLAVRGAA